MLNDIYKSIQDTSTVKISATFTVVDSFLNLYCLKFPKLLIDHKENMEWLLNIYKLHSNHHGNVLKYYIKRVLLTDSNNDLDACELNFINNKVSNLCIMHFNLSCYTD